MINKKPSAEIVEKLRHEYAAWFLNEYHVRIEFDGDAVKAPLLGGRSQGRSVSLAANVGWNSFLIARSTVVIKLPDPIEFDDGHEEPSKHYWPTQIKASIESQGYKIKIGNQND